MCGIVGFASSEGMKNRVLRQSYMEQGLAMDSFRGWDSTGVAAIEKLNEAPTIYKRALNGFDFIQQTRTQRLLADIEKYQVMIGHNRSATKGSVKDDNAHPFQYDNITLVHNGHISNAFDFPNNANADCYVDSSRVALSMARNGEKETLELCEGGFTFVWWNQDKQTLNIARNDKRPLWLGFIEGENTMFWASEWELLNLLVYRNGGTLAEHTVMFPEVSVWHQYNLKDLRAVTKVPFVLSQGRRQTQGGTGNTSGTGTGVGTENQDWEKEVEEWNRHLSDIRTSEGSASSDEIEEIRQDAASARKASDDRNTGIPTSKKRIAKATTELRKVGVTKFREKSLCTPVSWIKYKNQLKLGTCLAYSRKYGMTVEILNVKAQDFSDFYDRKLVAVEMVNVRHRQVPEGGVLKTQLVGVISDKMDKYLERHKRLKLTQEEGGDPGHKTTLAYTGMSGGLVSLERFKEITKAGCGWCSERADPDTHDRLVWMAGGDFLCASCASDKEILQNVGVMANDEPSYRAVH